MLTTKQKALFESRIVKTDSCWLWKGTPRPDGYCTFGIAKRYIHRIAYELYKASIPENLILDHLCRNRACCNPDHLEPVTHKINSQRGDNGINMASKTHCPQGHEYTPENTAIYMLNGAFRMRYCKQCRRNRARQRRLKLGQDPSP